MKYEITKGSEKDFEGAPEWCTIIYNYGNSDAVRFCNGWKEGCKFSGTKEFLTRQYDVSASDLIRYKIIAERRPITEPVVNQQLTTEWDGEGLPPVGIMCEISNHGQEFYPTNIVAITEEYLITKSAAEQHYYLKNIRFRPIRSPEDVARGEAIEAMRDVGYALPAAIRFTKEEMTALYDAGYRKME